MKKAIIAVLVIGGLSSVMANKSMCLYYYGEANKHMALLNMALERGDRNTVERKTASTIRYYEKAIVECESKKVDMTDARNLRKKLIEGK